MDKIFIINDNDMANNLRVFNLISDYNEAELVKPSVSFVVENGKVYYDDVPSPTFQGKWIATYSDSHTESAECDATSAITENEITKTNLVSVEIGDCVTSISNNAFSNCRSLTSCTIGSGVTIISNYTFQYCTSLTSIVIPDGVTSIGDSAFSNCSGLTSIVIPDSVTSIGQVAFNGCSGLTDVTFGSGLTNIGRSCFNNAKNVTTITSYAINPPNVEERAFVDIRYSVNVLYVPSESINIYKSASGWNVFASRIQAIPTPSTPKWLATYSDSHTESAECDATSAISENEINLESLVSVELGNCCNTIGSMAFYGCSSLSFINIPNNVTEIGEMAFRFCDGLTSVTIPSGVTEIGYGTFYMCTGLTAVTIGNGVVYIGDDAFGDCSSLTSIACLATVPPTLGSGALDSTNECNILVPSQSVSAYQSASGWSAYANRIQAIPT